MRIGVDRHNALLAVTGGSATELSATGAWGHAVAGDGTTVRLNRRNSESFNCLIGYGIDFLEMYRRAAVFIDKILQGIEPADIPIEQATKFLLLINMKTAKALGVNVPSTMLIRADELIE